MLHNFETLNVYHQARSQQLQEEARLYRLLYPHSNWRFRLAGILHHLADRLYQGDETVRYPRRNYRQHISH
jgi:hypothetical protein